MIDLSADDLQIIKAILSKYVPNCKIMIFGSRVNGYAKPYSDIDIAIEGSQEIVREIKTELQFAFEESDLPYRVDIVDWHGISNEFRKIILDKFEIIKI
jgi:predicted nucleotidyltransferase